MKARTTPEQTLPDLKVTLIDTKPREKYKRHLIKSGLFLYRSTNQFRAEYNLIDTNPETYGNVERIYPDKGV